MALLNILQYPDPRLKLVAKPVEKFDSALAAICTDLEETMYQHDGVGLAATQVNIQQRIFVLDVSKAQREPLYIINPNITNADGSVTWEEGCLSFPNIFAKVKRYATLTLEYCNLDGKAQRLTADGLLAVCIQHELDHLNGITFFDHLSSLKKKLLTSKIEKQRAKIV